MKPLVKFDYFDILYSLINQEDLNILRVNDLTRKLFKKQGYTKDFNYFLQSLGAVSSNWITFKIKSKGQFKITEKRRRLNEFLYKNLTLKTNRFLENHNIKIVNVKYVDVSSVMKIQTIPTEQTIITKDTESSDMKYQEVQEEVKSKEVYRSHLIVRESVMGAGISCKYSKLRLGKTNLEPRSIMSEWDFKMRHRVEKKLITNKSMLNLKRQLLEVFKIKGYSTKKIRNNLKRSANLDVKVLECPLVPELQSQKIFSLTKTRNFVDLTKENTRKIKVFKRKVRPKIKYLDMNGSIIENINNFILKAGMKNQERLAVLNVQGRRHPDFKISEKELISKLKEMNLVRREVTFDLTLKKFPQYQNFFNSITTVKDVPFKKLSTKINEILKRNFFGKNDQNNKSENS
jgi:hypothetical protein